MHIHQYGDLSQGCITVGPHYNPNGVDHPHHPGGLGNFASEQGVIRQFLTLPDAKLFGPYSILGRALVVHEKEDDLGMGSDEESKLSGNAGEIIALRTSHDSTPDSPAVGPSLVLPRAHLDEGGRVRHGLLKDGDEVPEAEDLVAV
ncbi:unnamed protein product [Leuciscus chuanchicus]